MGKSVRVTASSPSVRAKRLSRSRGELVAVQAAVGKVALKLDNGLSIGVTHAQIGSRPEPFRDVHALRP
jgi:hypothetical protein